MSSLPGRLMFTWKGPFGTVIRCLLVLSYERDGLKGFKLVRRVLWRVPGFYELFAEEQEESKKTSVIYGINPSNNAIAQRLDKSLRYQNEHPRFNSGMSKGLEIADMLYYRRTSISTPEMRELLKTHGASSSPAKPGYCYILMARDNYEKCKPGFTINPPSRLLHLGGPNVVAYYRILRFKHSQQAFIVEQTTLKKTEEYKISGEWRRVSPEEGFNEAVKIANELGFEFEIEFSDVPLVEFA